MANIINIASKKRRLLCPFFCEYSHEAMYMIETGIPKIIHAI